MDSKSDLKRITVISAVEADGSIIETLYRPDVMQTALVIVENGKIRITAELNDGRAIRVPVRPTNNLIRHQALLLPSQPLEYLDVRLLIAEMDNYVRRYVSLSEEAIALSLGYILLTWVYDAFNELPYLRFRGDYGTGKSRALLVIGSLCYKAFFASGASTVSPIFHTLDSFKGTLVFDEADFRFTDEKSELVKILNNGNSKGFPVLRTQVTPNKEFNPRAFSIYGPKIVGMRRSYEDPALESRFLTIEMEPGRAAGTPLNLPDEQKAEALRLRNMLLMYRLRKRLSVKLDPTLANPWLEPRMNQILLPLLSVLPDEAARAPVRASASALHAKVISDRETSTDGQVLSILADLLSGERAGPLALKDITESFTAKFGADYDRPVTTRWIGSVLRRLGILLYKTNGIVALAAGQDDRLAALRTRYGIGDTLGKNCEELALQGDREKGSSTKGIQ